MATVTTNQINQLQEFGGVPFGNETELTFNLTAASGIAQNTDQATALQIGDVVRLGILPKGLRLTDCLATISVAFAASTTASLGFAYTDGVDLTGANAQDAAYFITAGQSLATAAVVRKTGIKAPLVLQKDAYLILTLAGAAQTAAPVLDVSVYGINTGGN
jgi:hypothetical protein